MPNSDPLPPYSYVPGGPWPHPISSPQGHSFGHSGLESRPARRDQGASSPQFLRGVALFNAGYYWEAHEVWEGLWHAYGRRGVLADVIKALIKLAAAGVKVREGQEHGVRIHAGRAADLFASARSAGAVINWGWTSTSGPNAAERSPKIPRAIPGRSARRSRGSSRFRSRSIRIVVRADLYLHLSPLIISPDRRYPFSDDASHFDEHILLGRARSFQGLETMVGGVQDMKRRELFELRTNRLEKIHVREVIASATEKEHGDRHRLKVFGSLGFRPAGLVQWEGEEDQAAHAFERRFRRRR